MWGESYVHSTLYIVLYRSFIPVWHLTIVPRDAANHVINGVKYNYVGVVF